MNKEELIKIWENFCKKNDFKLNNKEHVEFIAENILKIEEQTGLKLCPCRLRDGTRKTDLELICPCNFKIQTNWKKFNRCWCGLFLKD